LDWNRTMIKGPINQLLAHKAEERSPFDARAVPDELRLPTLDQRVYLYLRAVSGKRDFTSKEYADARNLMLSAMAVDVAAKSHINVPEKPVIPTPLPGESPDGIVVARSLADYSDTTAAASLFEGEVGSYASYVPMMASARPYSAGGSEWLDTSPPQRENIAKAERTGVDVTAFPTATVPPRKVAKRAVYIWAAAGIVSVMVLLIIITPPPAWLGAGSNGTRITMSDASRLAPAPAATPVTAAMPVPKQLDQVSKVDAEFEQLKRVTEGPPDPVAAVLPRERTGAPTPSYPAAEALASRAPPIDAESPVDLVKQGEELLYSGRIPAARVVLKKAADAGSARAALALGMTYDPIELKKIGAKDSVPDRAMARTWYQKAKDLGSTEASARLKRLSTLDSRTR
jgi:hypothetical protein